MKKLFSKIAVAAFALIATVQGAFAAVGDLVTVDPTKEGMEAVTFAPGALVQPILLIIGAVIMSVAAIWLVVIGLKWLLKYLKG
jgi:hypothetical protein